MMTRGSRVVAMAWRSRVRLPCLGALVFATGFATGAGRAADLQPPRKLDTPGLAAAPQAVGCTVPAMPGPRRFARLIVRNALRHDVGPYAVRLPGYSTGQENSYRPFLLQANPGDTLRFDLVNELAAAADGSNAINLHTHGLITSPRPCAPFGDSVYVEDAPGHTGHYAIAIPATLPGSQFGGGGPDQPYPPGLNWFHAHVHGKARVDVMAGQSGMLQVGDLLATLRATPGLSAAARAALAATDPVYLGLRDIQLSVPAGATPDQPAAQGTVAQWLRKDDYDPTACASQANPAPSPPTADSFAGPGFCAHHAVTVGSAQPDPAKDTVWLFTVNGQAFPTIRTRTGRNQVWRIANLSANATYLLELTADSDPSTPLPMDVLSLDGLVAGVAAPGSTDLKVGVTLSHLLLMPASRAEVFVPAPAAGMGAMTLRTAGITTGVQGDPWPRIDLAHVVAPAAPAVTALQGGAAATPPHRPAMILPGMARLAAPAAAPQVQTNEAPPSHCVTLPPGQTVRRRITFANDPTGALFLLGSEVVTPSGTPIDAGHTIKPEQFPPAAMMDPASVLHVCPRFGEQEVWELVNTTGELHNFHIHQTKFRLSVPSDPGVPQGSLAIQDPTNIIASFVPEAQAAAPDAGVDVWHDVLPVPPADASGNPGRVFVTIPFHDQRQIGFFVFHCHILEHEDGGMMAVVQVFDPAHPQIAAGLSPHDAMAMAH